MMLMSVRLSKIALSSNVGLNGLQELSEQYICYRMHVQERETSAAIIKREAR